MVRMGYLTKGYLLPYFQGINKKGRHMSIGNIELILTSDLRPHPKNNNKHPKSQIKKLADSIRTHGFRVPIIISKLSGYIVAGHGRMEAAKLLGMESVPVIFQVFTTSEEEYAFLTSDNIISQESSIDFTAIRKEMTELMSSIPNLDLTSFAVDPDFLEEKKKQAKPKKEITVNVACPECGHSFNL